MIGDIRIVDGEKVQWNGFGLSWCANLYFVPLENEPDNAAISLILRAHQSGFAAGKAVGRAILQNEFSNLMNCQPR